MADMALQRTPEQEIERSVIWKLSLGLIPFLGLLYMFNMLDRTNVAVAALTFKKDLGFSDTVYGWGFGIFYIGYFFFEIPSNMIMERVGARRWIARIMITWGAVSACMMFMRTPISFYSLRILLGIAEAGFFPGIILYLTYWIPASLRARMISRFLFMTAFLGLFGPFINGLLLKLNGYMGLHGWQWLFLLEGIPSLLLGFVVLALLPNGPAEVTWLSQEQKDWIIARLAIDAKNDMRVQHLSLKVALTEPRIRMLCIIFIVTSVGGNAVGSFIPQLVKARSGNLWTDSYVAIILFIPALVGVAAMVMASGHSDRTGQRRMHVTLGYLVAGLAYLLCVFCKNAQWTLVALSLFQLGERSAAGSYWALTTNLLGVRAAASGIALINSVGNLGGFFGPILMGQLMDRTHKDYTPGLYIAAGFMVAGALCAYFMSNHPTEDPVPNQLQGETAPVLSQPGPSAS